MKQVGKGKIPWSVYDFKVKHTEPVSTKYNKNLEPIISKKTKTQIKKVRAKDMKEVRLFLTGSSNISKKYGQKVALISKKKLL